MSLNYWAVTTTMSLQLLGCYYDNIITITVLLLRQCHYNYWAVTTTMSLQLLGCYYDNVIAITGLLLRQCPYNYWAVTTTMPLQLLGCYYDTLWNFVDFVYVKYSGSYLTPNVHHIDTQCHYVRLHVKELLFLPDFHQTSSVSTNFSGAHKHKFSRKSVHWERT
jgi:hypothetical protein